MSHFRLNASIISTAQRTGRLDLHGRSLYTLPSDLFTTDSLIPFLTILDISENKLTELPGEEMQKLRGLKELYLDSNNLRTLPVELLALSTTLKSISLDNNVNLDPELRKVYEAAQPVWKSRARDTEGVWKWMERKYGVNRGGGKQQQEETAPSQQARDFADDYNSPPPVQQSSSQPQDDDDYMYAAMRARAAARALERDDDGGRSNNNNNFRDEEQQQRGRYQDEDNDRSDGGGRGGYNNRGEDDYSSNSRSGPPASQFNDSSYNSRDSQSQQQTQQQQSQQQRTPSSRFSSNPSISTRKDSPFFQDPQMKMESRENQSVLNERKELRNAAGSAASNNNTKYEQDEKTYGRKSNARADRGTPFGTDANMDTSQQGNRQQARPAPYGVDGGNNNSQQQQYRNNNPNNNSNTGGGSRTAPFGTDLNAPSYAAKRVSTPSKGNKSALSSPYAADDDRVGNTNSQQDHNRGVRLVPGRGSTIDSIGTSSSPYGTIPPSLAGVQYTTSSAAASDHVQAARAVRDAGGLDMSGNRSYNSNSSHNITNNNSYADRYEDGAITGNGPRNVGGVRQPYRTNSDIFHRQDDVGGGRGGQQSQQQQQHQPRSPYARNDDPSFSYGGGSNNNKDDLRSYQRDESSRSSSRAAGNAIIGGGGGSNDVYSPTNGGNQRFAAAQSQSRSNSRQGSAPFAREADVAPAVQQTAMGRGGNRSNQSSVFNGEQEKQQAQFAPGRGGPIRQVKDTSLW